MASLSHGPVGMEERVGGTDPKYGRTQVITTRLDQGDVARTLHALGWAPHHKMVLHSYVRIPFSQSGMNHDSKHYPNH
jgi:hypothetical protein